MIFSLQVLNDLRGSSGLTLSGFEYGLPAQCTSCSCPRRKKTIKSEPLVISLRESEREHRSEQGVRSDRRKLALDSRYNQGASDAVKRESEIEIFPRLAYILSRFYLLILFHSQIFE